LQKALTRRGIELAALLGALVVADGAAKAVPAALARKIIAFGLLVAAGEPAAGVIPARVAELAAGVTRAMLLTKAKIATVFLLAVGMIAVGAGVLTRQTVAARETAVAAKNDAEQAVRAAKPQAAEDDTDALVYAGRVLGPDDRPVSGAKLYLTMGGELWQPPHERPTTGPDGRFHFTVSKAHYGDWWTVVTAAAASYGPGWVVVPADGKRDDLTLRLVTDDGPIAGQIVDLEGEPVAGATLRVRQIDAAPGDDLGPWLEAVKGKTGRSFDLEKQYLKRTTYAVSPQATTDAEGRFRLTGIGRNRLARLRLEGPGI